MVKTLYQIVNHECEQAEVFEQQEQADAYINYLAERQAFEFHEQAHRIYPVARWADELILYASADEAIADYEERRGKPISGEDRYTEYKKKWEAADSKAYVGKRLVDADTFERFEEWKKNNPPAQ